MVNFILVFAFYFKLPDTIPIHFNVKGEADGFGSRSSLWLTPSISALTYLLMVTIIKNMKPWNFNYPTKVTEKNAPELYRMALQMMVWLNFGIVVMFLVITLEIILKALRYDGISLGSSFIGLIAIITLLPLWYSYKMIKVPKE